MREAHEIIRRERFRRGALLAMYLAVQHSPDGYLRGDAVCDNANSSLDYSQKVQTDELAIGLIRNLVQWGLAEEKPADALNRGESLKLVHLKFRITGKGTDLYEKNIAPIKGVWDERVTF